MYTPTIGLEIHAELKTRTKMFCYSLNDPNEKHPNFNICPICMGHPGTLPTINEDAVKKVIMVGLALNGTVPEYSQFDRKNYFYPDLPKGYQISQYKHPLVEGGHLDIAGKKIRITRIHLEEDAGRLIHDKDGSTLVDFNRAGVPLMELVTEPDFHTGEEVRLFGEELQKILRYIGASDADMEKGQMRVEVNISLSTDPNVLGTKVEVKNINSFKFAEDAANHEMVRQKEILDRGEKIVQETRGWNERKKESVSQRKKEEAHDYRYFPEPDLPPLKHSPEYIQEIRNSLPELPQAKRERFAAQYSLEGDILETIVREKSLADFFEGVVSEVKLHEKDSEHKTSRPLEKTVGALVAGDFLKLTREFGASTSDIRISQENLGELALYLAQDRISNTVAKDVLKEMFHTGSDPSDIIGQKKLWQVSGDGEINEIVSRIIESNPKSAADFRAGKKEALQFLIGQAMRETQGRAHPKTLTEMFQKKLSG